MASTIGREAAVLVRRVKFSYAQINVFIAGRHYDSPDKIDGIPKTTSIRPMIQAYRFNTLEVLKLSLLMRQPKALQNVLAEYDQQIDALAKTPRCAKPVQAVNCYNGIKNLFALTRFTEIGDVKRFPHPRQLPSRNGMHIREYSSGSKHNRFGMIKQGNQFVRPTFIETNRRSNRTTQRSNQLKARRKDTDPDMIAIANGCSKRLNKKGARGS